MSAPVVAPTRTKKAQQLALPHTTSYKLISTYFAGKLLDGGGCICRNCGRGISQVAIVENEAGERFDVGLDCAQTLAGITSEVLSLAEEAFAALKQMRGQLKKAAARLAGTDRRPQLSIERSLGGDYIVEGHYPDGGALLFRSYVAPFVFERIIVAACPELAGLPVKPAPTVYGEQECRLKRGEFVLYQGRARLVMSVDANLSLPASNYRQKLGLLGVNGVYVAVEDLDQLEPVPNPATT